MSDKYNDVLEIMGADTVILIEDSIQFEKSKVYVYIADYFKLCAEDKLKIRQHLGEDSELVKKLFELEQMIETNPVNWDSVAGGNLAAYFTLEELKNEESLFNEIVGLVEIEQLLCFNKYGLGVLKKALGSYEIVLDNILKGKQDIRLRIIGSYYEAEEVYLDEILKEASERKKYVAIFIDDNMDGENKGDSIINHLNENDDARLWAIPILFSQNNRKEPELNAKNLHVEFVLKEGKDVDKRIQSAFIRSQYSTLLKVLRKHNDDAYDDVFESAENQVSVVGYLASMAGYEGTTNFEVVSQWLSLKTEYYMFQEKKEAIKELVLLSSLLEGIMGPEEMEPPHSSPDIQVFENFDYMVNDLHKPPMPGDIFFIENGKNSSYYMMIGQNCEQVYRGKKRDSSLANMLKIDMLSADEVQSTKVEFEADSVIVNYFRTSREILSKIGDDQLQKIVRPIRINCTKPEQIDHEILDLCTFNENGSSKIENTDLNIRVIMLLPKDWREYHSNLSQRLNSVKDKKTEMKELFTVFEDSFGKSYSKRLIHLMDMEEDGKAITYNISRVCRLKNYTTQINRILSEYQIREGFNTINYDIVKPYSVSVIADKKKVVMNFNIRQAHNRNHNRGSRIFARDWLVTKEDLMEFLKDTNTDGKALTLKVDNGQVVFTGLEGELIKGKLHYKKYPFEVISDETIKQLEKREVIDKYADSSLYLHISACE